MKVTTYILAAALLAPGAIIFGVAATAAIATSVTAGTLAIALHDYGSVKADCLSTEALAKVATAKATERHPLAA